MLNFPFSSELSGLVEGYISRKKLISNELIRIIFNNLTKITKLTFPALTYHTIPYHFIGADPAFFQRGSRTRILISAREHFHDGHNIFIHCNSQQ